MDRDGPPPRKRQRRPLPTARPPPEPEPAPEFQLGTREIVAVEHPGIIQNLDNGLKTFGNNQPFERIVNCIDPDECIPLYLRLKDPTCPPILSQSTSTQNIVLKITVPKPTGRRRKKGSQGPFMNYDAPGLSTSTAGQNSHDVHIQEEPVPSLEDEDAPFEEDGSPKPILCSHSRMDSSLRRKLMDNVGKYTCEAVAEVKRTHRFRGLADFHQSTTHSSFFSKFRDTALTGNIEKMRDFKFDPSRGPKVNEDIIQPPTMTIFPLPFNWAWQQNPHITQEIDPVTGKLVLVNTSRLERMQVEYLPHYMENIPQGPSQEPPDDQELAEVIKTIKELYEERLIWTRRAIINRVNFALTEATLHLIRTALPYIGYRFKDGPFRDAIIQFGLDPRTDPKYRIYQTIYFQLAEREAKDPSAPWIGIRKSTKTPKQPKKSNDKLSHFFDGRDVAIDGKIWQMCDVTDPLLARLIKESPIAETFDAKNDGWFCNGTLAKIRAIMKVKMIALHTGRALKDEDFKKALEMPDIIPNKEGLKVWVPIPDVRLSKEEMEKLRASGRDFTVMSGLLKQKRAYTGRRMGNSKKQPDEEPGSSRPGGDQHRKLTKLGTGIRKSMSAASPEEMDESRRPSSAESIDPRLLADHFSRARIRDDGDVDMGDYGEYDSEMEGSEADHSSDLDEEDEEDGEMEDFAHSSEAEDDTREAGGGDSETESISMVEYHDEPPQLKPSIEKDG